MNTKSGGETQTPFYIAVLASFAQLLRIARKYDVDLAHLCNENELGEREQLVYLGIYARPELYELAGNCQIQTERGNIFVGAAPHGLALPSTLIDSIVSIDLTAIRCITFIENKTNYDEYVISEKQSDELVVYHGGFLSLQKRKLVTLISHAVPQNIKIQFWADIDMGEFRMFDNLQKLIPSVLPMRMSGELVDKFYRHGLVRSKSYLSELETDLKSGKNIIAIVTIKIKGTISFMWQAALITGRKTDFPFLMRTYIRKTIL